MVRKKGQQMMGMSFGMIFAIFLIAVFFVMAFIAVQTFIDWGKIAKIGLFYEDFQEEVSDAWAGQSSNTVLDVDLPKGIKKVCFADFNSGNYEENSEIRDYEVHEESNIFLIPLRKSQGLGHKHINHLDISKITSSENPYCISVKDGINIKKDFNDRLVAVS
jgi:hypothetical protein